VNNVNLAEMQQFGTVWPQCVARAWQDAQFCQALKRDPVGTLREAYQFTVPAGLNLQVVEGDELVGAQQANTLRMVIPPMPEMDMQEVALVCHGPGPGNGNGNGPRFTFSFSATLC
jgi:ribosomally synthesized peptide (two-chain TOMM family)